nr:FKBP-type peptidyl-prolyl cis-trans isomerase [Geothrix sp. SG200]
MIRRFSTLAALLLALPWATQPLAAQTTAPARKRAQAPRNKKKVPAMITTLTGLQYVDTQIGTGALPQRGQRCSVHYTGWLSDHGKKGKKFDSSLDRGEPLVFPVGVGRVIKGWDEGLMTMKVGGKRTLYIPAALGYGARGAGGEIPPNADLIFEVELLGVQ